MLRRIINRHFSARPFPFRLFSLIRPKKKSSLIYNVITAAYNVEPYLDDYFKSITRQTLDFTGQIRIIIVDDGSTDRTADIIKKWQNLYPKSIIGLRQENCGQGAARNLGLTRAEGDYVTFIDADDFISPGYFAQIDHILNRTPNVALLAARQAMLYELSGNVRDNSPLRVFHGLKDISRDINDHEAFIQIAVSSAVFPLAKLRKLNLSFGERPWPAFEDAHFVLRYLMRSDGGRIVFAAKPVYYYRKRARKDSTMNLARTRPELYGELLEEVHLELLQEKQPSPIYVQKTILFDLSPKIRAVLAGKIPLTTAEGRRFFKALEGIFQFIDVEVIKNYPENLNDFSDLCRAGILFCFKGVLEWVSPAVVDRCDPSGNMIHVRYFTGRIDRERVGRDHNRSLKVLDAKTTGHYLGGELFCYERGFWLPWSDNSDDLTLFAGDRSLILKNDPQEVLKRKKKALQKKIPTITCCPPKRDSNLWLFADRLDQADDNAEHLYRYTAAKAPELEIYFLLQRQSPDWKRLQKEGFQLVDFRRRNRKFQKLLARAGKIISSQTDLASDSNHILPLDQYFIFLQHGVIKDDMSAWLNTFTPDLMLTSTAAEHESLIGPGSPYLISNREVALTGLPRHDALLKTFTQPVNEIMIAPTWRRDLSSATEYFFNSAYAERWLEFLRSPQLIELAEQNKLTIVFVPHPNMRNLFKASLFKNIKFISDLRADYQLRLKKAALLVTDYSSVAFEAAFLRRPCLYYQFDAESVFSGNHTTARGYFDYERDAFGPICHNLDTLLQELERLLTIAPGVLPFYLERMQATFPTRDGRNCERAYQAIMTLGQSVTRSTGSR